MVLCYAALLFIEDNQSSSGSSSDTPAYRFEDEIPKSGRDGVFDGGPYDNRTHDLKFFDDRDNSVASANSTELFEMYDDILLAPGTELRMPSVILGGSLAEMSTLSDANHYSVAGTDNAFNSDYIVENLRRRTLSRTSLVSEGSLDKADGVASILSISSRRDGLTLASYARRGEGVHSDEILRRLRHLTWDDHEYYFPEAKSHTESAASADDVDSWQ